MNQLHISREKKPNKIVKVLYFLLYNADAILRLAFKISTHI